MTKDEDGEVMEGGGIQWRNREIGIFLFFKF